MLSIVLFLLAFLISVIAGFGQDPELTNYKTGITATWSGTKGTDYQEEYWYHDKLVNDTKVVFARSTVQITFGHNSQNIASRDGSRDKSIIGTGTGVGHVRYHMDKIWQEKRWAPAFDGGGTLYPSGQTPFTIASTGQVGLTGYNSGGNYWEGLIDSVGDEWHVLFYADDDSNYSGFTLPDGFDDAWASDGKYVLFVVNPITPAMTIRASGSGQFYTTPAWTYWVPKIHDQTTYFQGTCTFELKNIYGNNISYRINGGSTVNVGAATVTLDQDNFSTGSNTLEYWYTATPGTIRTRTVVKNPGFPSATETHGERLMGGSAGWTAFQSRATRAPYAVLIAEMQTDDGVKQTSWDGKRLQGWRFGGRNWPIGNNVMDKNAIAAKYLGWTAYRSGATGNKTYAQYAKEMLLESPLANHPVGYETSLWASYSLPCADTVYRGYWDSAFAYNAAIAYDILIGGYRSDQYSGGITPIEDYYLRDMLASWVHLSVLVSGGVVNPTAPIGMWTVSRGVGATVIACAMPKYSTSYYGTSGIDGSTTVYQWAPWQNANYTWKRYFLDDDYPTQSTLFVAPKFRFGMEGSAAQGSLIWPPSYNPAVWVDKISYASWPQCGFNIAWYANMVADYGTLANHTYLTNYLNLATNGTLQGNKTPVGPGRIHMITNLNENFPQAASNATAWIQSGDGSTEAEAINDTGLPVIWFYDDTYYGGAVTPTVDTPVISPPGSSGNSGTVNVTMTCGTAGATIRYTTDGSDPTSGSTVYSGSIPITVDTTVKARGFLASYNDSGIASETYLFGTPTVDTPVISPPGSSGNSGTVNVTMTCATGGAAIHYTLDGSTPDNGDPVYSTALAVTTDTTVKAIGILATYNDSAVATETYTFAVGSTLNAPSIAPSGNWMFSQSVTITADSNAETTYYTTDGSTPTTASNVYSAPFDVSANATIKSYSVASGYDDSPVTSVDLVIGELSLPSPSIFYWTYAPDQDATGTLNFDVLLDSGTGHNFVCGLGLNPTGSFTFSDFAIVIRASGGVWQAYNSTTYTAENSLSATGDTLYHLSLDYDIPNQTFSLDITPDGGSATTIATDYGFRNVAPAVLNAFVGWYSTNGGFSDAFAFPSMGGNPVTITVQTLTIGP